MTRLWAAPFLVLLIVCLANPLEAQQLSMRRYNVANGLAHDQVTSLLEDSRGYLWIGTFEGLSRFDGSAFVSYGIDDGIGHYLINDLVEDPHGRLWVATNGGGVSMLNDAFGATPLFSSYVPGPGAAQNVNAIVFDAAGRLWCGTDGGVYVADVSGPTPVFTAMGYASHAAVAAAVQGERVWMGVSGVGLVKFEHDRPIVHPVPWSFPSRFRHLLADGREALVSASDAGLHQVVDGDFTAIPVSLGSRQVPFAALHDGHGGLWLGTNEGLVHYDGRTTRRYSLDRARGGWLTSVLIDRGGNLWVGLGQAGVVQIRSEQIVSYTPLDGLPDADVTALVEDPAGAMFGITRRGQFVTVNVDGVRPHAGFSMAGHRAVVPHPGGWWALGSDGVYHVPGSPPRFDRARKLESVPPAWPVPSSVPFVQTDRYGHLWFGSGSDPALHRITNPATAPRMERWPIALPHEEPAGVLGVDRAGGIWLANMTTLARFADGRVTQIAPPPGLPNVQPRAFMVDRAGAVWIGLRFGGVLMTRDPAASPPQFVRYGWDIGLASDAVWALAEDAEGRIYLGTGRGLDQFDPRTGRVRHFSTDDGLAGNVINSLKVDAAGTVWVAAMGGISRLDLDFAPPRRAPIPVYITGVHLAGVSRSLPARGATHVSELQLPFGGRNLRIEFVTPGFQHPGRIRYQYMLDGVDAQWSAPAGERAINYATLSPGRYRFQVRAVAADGRTSETPAVVEFVIQPPFWSQTWFIATGFAVILGAALGVRRLREQRRRGMAAIRRQVATDLHDDVGSGLSQIAILSEVAKRDASSQAMPSLNEVADLARSLRDSMSDIVWAVDPGRDDPVAVVERMRQVTFNLLPSGAEVTFHAPDERELSKLDLWADRRRQLLLIFKEAITNVARHAHATKVTIQLEVQGNLLHLTVRDNGVGFDVVRQYDGHGLENLANRARSIGAEIEIRSRQGEGSTIILIIPLRRATRMFRWLRTTERRG